MRMLVTVSTKDRPSLAGICLFNVIQNISPESELVVLDDHSTLLTDNWFKHFGVKAETFPSGKWYALARLDRFLSSQYDYCVSLDGDMLVDSLFDQKIYEAWKESGRTDLIGTGYISRLHKPETIKRFPNYVILPSTGGGCHFYSRSVAKKLVKGMAERGWWKRTWDGYVRQVIPAVVSTPHSVVQHIGIYEGMNSDENNIGQDFCEDFIPKIRVGTIK
jgi:hypothetical protein